MYVVMLARHGARQQENTVLTCIDIITRSLHVCMYNVHVLYMYVRIAARDTCTSISCNAQYALNRCATTVLLYYIACFFYLHVPHIEAARVFRHIRPGTQIHMHMHMHMQWAYCKKHNHMNTCTQMPHTIIPAMYLLSAVKNLSYLTIVS